MLKKKKASQKVDSVNEKKEKRKRIILAYLKFAPIYKYAAAAAGITDDTLKAWRDEKDSNFSEQCEKAISGFVKRTVRRTRPEFQLERMLKRDFSQRTELTGKDGQELVPQPIYGGKSTKKV